MLGVELQGEVMVCEDEEDDTEDASLSCHSSLSSALIRCSCMIALSKMSLGIPSSSECRGEKVCCLSSSLTQSHMRADVI